MKKIFLLLLIFFILMFATSTTYASSSDEIMSYQFDIIDIDNFNNQLKSLNQDYTEKFDLKDTIAKLVKGEMDISIKDMTQSVLKTIFKEIYNQISIMRNLIFIACICAMAKNLSSSFQSKAVGDMAFYICYIVVVIMLLQSFRIAVELTSETIKSISSLLDIFLPVLGTLLITTANYISFTIFHPVAILTGEVITRFIKNMILPVIFSTSILEIVNYISEKQVLGNMSELIKKCISWCLRGVALLFTTTLTLHKLTAPVAQGVINKTAKLAVGTIPVVGEVMTNTVDTIASWTGLVKNGTVLSVIIFMILLCSIPVFKLIALIFIYKFTAAIIQPISDSRIVKCIDSIASSCQLLLGALVCVMVMFIFIAMIGISTAIV